MLKSDLTLYFLGLKVKKIKFGTKIVKEEEEEDSLRTVVGILDTTSTNKRKYIQ